MDDATILRGNEVDTLWNPWVVSLVLTMTSFKLSTACESDMFVCWCKFGIGISWCMNLTVSVSHSTCVVDTKVVKHLKCASDGPMYQPSVACDSHVLRWCGFSWIMALHPKMDNDVLLKLNFPEIASCANMSRFFLHSLNMFVVSSTCCISLHQRCNGKCLCVPDNIAMKCCLNVLISTSAVLRRCVCGGTSW